MEDKDLNELRAALDDVVVMHSANNDDLINVLKEGRQRWIAIHSKNISVENQLYLIENHFVRKGLDKKTDWVVVDESILPNPNKEMIYELLYDYQNKIIVFKNIPDLFEGSDKYHFWKEAFECDQFPMLRVSSKDTNRFFNPDCISPRERYYLESNEDKYPDHFRSSNIVITISDSPTLWNCLSKQKVPRQYINSLVCRATYVTL